MKKIKYILTILLLAIILIPVVFAKDSVSIESYELIDNSTTTTELSEPKVNGLNISFDLSFGNLNDYAKYKVVINNPTTNDYEINKDTDFNKSEYITYTFDFEKDSNYVPSKSKVTMYVTITYSKEVPTDKLVDGKFIENNKMAISLLTDTSSTSKEENPNTGNSILIISVLLLSIALLSLVLFGTTKRKRYINLFIISLLLIPTTIFAIEKLQINVETKITIDARTKHKVSYRVETYIKESEQSNYVLIPNYGDNACKETKYRIDGEVYLRCLISIDSMHYAGERVPVNIIITKSLTEGVYHNNTFEAYCVLADDGIKDCISTAMYDVQEKSFVYRKGYNPTSTANDLEIMNFQSISHENWSNTYGSIGFLAPNEFTMPDHDVIFTIPEPSV